MKRTHYYYRFLYIALTVLVLGCVKQAAVTPSVSPEAAFLAQINTRINHQAQPCPKDFCLDDWPDVSQLDALEYWDCKAYAVAKADQLIRQYGYHPTRLEYVLVAGVPLRVTHAALLVDGYWVMDNGTRCQLCSLEQFAAGVNLIGRLPVTELLYLQRALQEEIRMQKD